MLLIKKRLLQFSPCIIIAQVMGSNRMVNFMINLRIMGLDPYLKLQQASYSGRHKVVNGWGLKLLVNVAG